MMAWSGAAPAPSDLHVIEDEFQTSTLGLHALALGRAQRLDAESLVRLGDVANEIASNIVRHAGGGQVILRAVGEPGTGFVEVLGLDKGPGIADMTRVMRENYATPAGPVRESGLARVRRVADLFDVYSQAGHGTAIVARVGSRSGSAVSMRTAAVLMRDCLGIVSVALRGEHESGDSWAVDTSDGRTTALLVDGLGHGPDAAAAALAALEVFRTAPTQPAEALLAKMHEALRRTRGAALSMAVLDEADQSVRFCGVGNVEARVACVQESRHLMPQNGIVGHNMPGIHATVMPWPAHSRVVMHSDGISSRWKAADYPGLLARHPILLAGVIFRDFARARDDATIIVMRDPLPA